VAKEILQHTMGTLEYIKKLTCVVGIMTTVQITFLQARPNMVSKTGHLTRSNIKNTMKLLQKINTFFLRVHCDCEVEFKNCLKTANSEASDDVGQLYFDFVGNECFKLEFPITACKKYSE
jgi:Phospholipase A2